eukprot:TRINITY_DN9309_c0_g2_i1.p1 TRINITY_DN9309_c0_g2~~TRINITY_DN9309_c0_g2_i1.p1  ORF type:complete len:273 (-),score=60.10 TRINITY_DN9309_c0_g2_i1:36-854(-)
MKPAWDKLMAEYEDSGKVLVAGVNCDAEGKSLCKEFGVKSYPSLMYSEPDSQPLEYTGEREFDDMNKFVQELLGPKCGPEYPDMCDADNRKLIEEFTALPLNDLDASIKEKEDLLTAADTELEELLKTLQQGYDEARTASRKRTEERGLKLLRSVLAYRERISKALYLPKAMGSVQVLKDLGDGRFQVLPEKGVAYRLSKNLEDRDAVRGLDRDQIVEAVDEGEWIRVPIVKSRLNAAAVEGRRRRRRKKKSGSRRRRRRKDEESKEIMSEL